MILGLVGLFAQSQIVNQFVSFGNDTTTNTETSYMTIASAVPIVGNYTAAILLGGTNASGTATVSASLQVSDNGTIWYNHGSAITLNNAGTVSNYSWTLAETAYKYYRIRLISSGSGVTHCTAKLGLKRK